MLRSYSPFSQSFRLGALAAALSISLGAGPLHASENFPATVRDQLDMPCLPTCLLCHTVNPGVAGTAKQEFVSSMGTAAGRPAPMRAGDTTWVVDGLAGLGDTDTDTDGMSDIDELKAARDPNVIGEGDICAPEVRYGCGAAHVARSAPGGSNGAAWFVLGGLSLAALARTRRRKVGT